jgi:hypothetical protein
VRQLVTQQSATGFSSWLVPSGPEVDVIASGERVGLHVRREPSRCTVRMHPHLAEVAGALAGELRQHVEIEWLSRGSVREGPRDRVPPKPVRMHDCLRV